MITTQILPSGRALVFLPLPPGTNHRLTPIKMGRYARMVLSKDARGYLDTVGTALRFWRAAHDFKTIQEHQAIEMWVIMRRVGSDCHNYLKELCDVLEIGKIVENDSLILPRIMGIWHNTENPGIIIKL